MGRPAQLSDAASMHSRGRAETVDAVIAGALVLAGWGVLIVAVGGSTRVVGVAGVAIFANGLAVAVRRRRPEIAALAAIVGVAVYQVATGDPIGAVPPVAVVLCSYTLGTMLRTRPRVAAAVGVVAAAPFAFLLASAGTAPFSIAQPLTAWLAMVLAPLIVGLGVARQRELADQLAVAAAQLKREEGMRAERASAEERNRVARDMHDVVSHAVSVMVVQAGAARLVAPKDPAAAHAALKAVGASGRDAVDDLRRIVGVLHRDVDPDFGSGSGLADLPRLVERVRAGGVTVELHVSSGSTLPPMADLVAYRIVQEALTNVLKHRGPAATATVSVTVGADDIEIDVRDTGDPEVVAASQPAGGHGLIGMRERVLRYGGSLEAGPLPERGFGVHAVFPWREPVISGDEPWRAVRGNSGPSWWRWRPAPVMVDALVVAVWLVAMEIEATVSHVRRGPWVWNAAVVAAMALAALWRRRAPLVFLAVVGGLAALLSSGLASLDHSTVTGLYCLAVPLYAVATWRTRNRATVGLLAWLGGVVTIAVVHRVPVGAMLGAGLMGVLVWCAGRVRHAQTTLNAELSATISRLEAEQQARARDAVTTERLRIAREMHGLVARGVVEMVVRTELAQRLLCVDVQKAGDAIASVEEAGRDVLSRLRAILGVLRASGGPQRLPIVGAFNASRPALGGTRFDSVSAVGEGLS